MANDKRDKFLTNILWPVICTFATLCLTGFFVLLENIEAKEKTAVKVHTAIRKEANQSETEIRKELNSEIKEVRQELKIAHGQRERILAILEGMKNDRD